MEQWDTIYKNNAAKMLGVCRRYVKDDQQAEDLMHNAFMTAMSKSDTYSGKGLFEGWLRRIAVNTALMFLRSNKKSAISEKEPIENYPEPVQEVECSEETQRNTIEEAGFNKQELLEVVDQLPDHHKMVFNLYVIDGYSHKEIGKMLDISDGTSKSHLARARKKIQQLLFEKAEDKKKNKKRGFFFLFFTKENYIDKMYKDAFSSFEIQPQTQTPLQEGTKLVNTQQKFSTLSKIVGNKIILISSICSVISLSIITVFLLYPKTDSIQNKENSAPEPTKTEQQVSSAKENKTPTESTIPAQTENEIAKPEITKTPPINNKKVEKAVEPSKSLINPPTQANNKKTDSVVVKKPFVVHKSIIKHDTIIQKTPVNNEK